MGSFCLSEIPLHNFIQYSFACDVLQPDQAAASEVVAAVLRGYAVTQALRQPEQVDIW